jgi:hypothetical protein
MSHGPTGQEFSTRRTPTVPICGGGYPSVRIDLNGGRRTRRPPLLLPGVSGEAGPRTDDGTARRYPA